MNIHPFWSIDNFWGTETVRPSPDLVSNTETVTALGATGGDHLAAANSAHPDQKTVGTLTAHNGRLIRAFHVKSLMYWES